VGVAVVAVTGHRRTLRLTDRDATVVFARRKIATLDVERGQTIILVDDDDPAVGGQGPAVRGGRRGRPYPRRVHITRNGREYVVLISAEDLESLEATIELLSDPKAMARVQQAEADIAGGQETTAEEMAALMVQRRARERSA